MRSLFARAVGLIGLSLGCLGGQFASAAEDAGDHGARAFGTLEVVPAALELCPGRDALVRVTAKDSHAAKLSWQSAGNASITAVLAPDGKQRREPHTWLLQVRWPSGELVPGLVHLLPTAEGAGKSPVSAGSFEIKAAVPELAPLKVELQAPWDKFDDRQTLPLRLVLANPTGATVRVLRIQEEFQPFSGEKRSVPPSAARSPPFDIPPGAVEILNYRVGLDRHVSEPAGKKRLMVRVDAESHSGGCSRALQQVASRDFDFNVFGESAVLTAAGIPAFLLVPGFLAIMTPLLLWQLGWRPGLIGDREEFWFPASKPEFWTLAITFSLLAWFLVNQIWPNVFVAYRLEQIAGVWAGSMLISGALYSGVVLWTRRREAATRKMEEAQRETEHQRIYRTQDSPLDLLGRMALRGASMSLRRVKVDLSKAQLGSGMRLGLLLERGEHKAVVVPGIRWTGKPSSTQVEDSINAALQNNDAAALHAILVSEGSLSVKWSEEPDEITGLLLVPLRSLVEEGAMVSLVGND